MSRLLTILFYKYLRFSLAEIKKLLDQKEDQILQHLRKQYSMMLKEKEKLLTLIDTLEKTIKSTERKTTMTTKQKFKGFTYQDNQKYRDLAADMYGKDVVEAAIEKQQGKERELTDGFNEIFFSFAHNMEAGLVATSEENIELSKRLHEHICTYSFDCSLDIFSRIGQGYAESPDFKNNIDKFGEGTAKYVCDAIQRYVKEW